MPTTDARIQANRQNALRSTGPKTEEGKERSRANSLKHGMTGEGIVLAEADAIEIKRRSGTFAQELNAVGDLQVSIAHRAALNSVRMERGADQQTAALIERIRQLEADFVAPEGSSDEDADRLRLEASRRAMFDPSKEACLARRYEAAAERCFFKALKELRQVQTLAKLEPQPVVAAPAPAQPAMGSFLPAASSSKLPDSDFESILQELDRPTTLEPADSVYLPHLNKPFDLMFSVGKSR